MKHLNALSAPRPKQAESLLVWQQKAAVLAAFAAVANTGIGIFDGLLDLRDRLLD